jgi:hypothetical protein
MALLSGCKDENPKPEIKIVTPSKVQLVFPLKNSECNEGRFITDTESTITFEWRSVEDADEYEIFITNLSSTIQNSYTTTDDTLSVVLQRAAPYSWYVASKAAGVDSSEVSEVWKFYNAGEGIQSHVPFPADIISPTMAQKITASSGSITLDWEGSDLDDDIVGYDVFFGTTSPPELFASDLIQSALPNVSVSSGTVYYWSVTTKDAYGNRSETGVYQFKVE